MTKLRPYTDLLNKHNGENAFVLGAGTSLYELSAHPNFDSIQDHVVISVNSSFILMPWEEGDSNSRYWVSNDSLCRRWTYWPFVKSCNAIKVVRDSWEKYYDEIPDFLYFWPRPTSEGVINPEDKGVAYCSSVPTAIDLAIQMGCKNIFLLGVDHYQSKKKTHFWEFYERSRRPVMAFGGLPKWQQQRRVFDYNDIAYEALNGFAETVGSRIVNCSLMAKVKPFEKLSFDKSLKIVGE